MKKLLSIFSLVRIQNLLIIAATQYLMRYCILYPFLHINRFELQMDNLRFLLLVLSTVFIAAAGYVINDYFDTGTDRLNRPGKVVIDFAIERRKAMFYHFLLSFLGVATGIYLSFYVQVPELSIIFILAAGLLWFYSTNYKRQFLIGNLVVSAMTCMVPLLVILFELPLLNLKYGLIMMRHNVSFNYLFYWILAFSFFAFFTTLIREIIKDAEDFEGDSAFGMNTMPILIGIRKTRIVVASLIVITLALLCLLFYKFLLYRGGSPDYLTITYFSVLLFLPFILLFLRIITASQKSHYIIASRITKFIMLAGILFSVLVRYIVLNKLI
jgi:4-hydroxybenzoate polyprenyltransferase